MDPNLTAHLRAHTEALRNDLEQAHELAAEFQRQLAGKTNEFAQMKQILEKTQRDLEGLQAGIIALREERHRLANDVMIATAYRTKAERAGGDEADLRIELELTRQALAREGGEMVRCLRVREVQIAELTLQNVTLKRALAEAKGKAHDLGCED